MAINESAVEKALTDLDREEEAEGKQRPTISPGLIAHIVAQIRALRQRATTHGQRLDSLDAALAALVIPPDQTAAVQALDTRLTAVEQKPDPGPRLTALEADVAALTARVAALEPIPPP